MFGLRVHKGQTIPQVGVIGGYTGVVECSTRFNSSAYSVAIGNMHTDAEKQGNVLRLVNHRCINYNAMMVIVINGGLKAIYFRAIKMIQGGEFVLIHYQPNYKKFFQTCACMHCKSKKTTKEIRNGRNNLNNDINYVLID